MKPRAKSSKAKKTKRKTSSSHVELLGVGRISKKELPEFLQKTADALMKQIELTQEELKKPLPSGYEPMIRYIKPGDLGDVSISHFHVNELASIGQIVEAASTGRPNRAMLPGTYVRMIVGKEVMMSDTHHEVKTCRKIMEEGHGDVLIGGLGIGMILVPLLKNPKVKSVTVIELNWNVINLVEPQIRKALPEFEKKLVIQQGDIGTFVPTVLFDCIWFDIWPSITPKNLLDIIPFERKFEQYLKPGGWIASWMKEDLIEWAEELRQEQKQKQRRDKDGT